jgi:hypothetical protein
MAQNKTIAKQAINLFILTCQDYLATEYVAVDAEETRNNLEGALRTTFV